MKPFMNALTNAGYRPVISWKGGDVANLQSKMWALGLVPIPLEESHEIGECLTLSPKGDTYWVSPEDFEMLTERDPLDNITTVSVLKTKLTYIRLHGNRVEFNEGR